MSLFDAQVAHLAQLAQSPGWWQHARQAAGAIEGDEGHYGLFIGLRAAVGAAIQASGYKPARHELSELWIQKTKGVTK